MLRAVSFDVLIVLGCRVRGGQLTHAARRRVERAAQAFRERENVLVIATGGKSWDGFQGATSSHAVWSSAGYRRRR
jgi:hypothetical protein